MANFTGTYSTNQTVNNGDSFTGSITINGASVFTISAGATVTCADSISVTVGSSTTGSLQCVGTEANPIILKPSAADPGTNQLGGFGTIAVSGSTVNIQYTKLNNWATAIDCLGNDLAVINVTINHVWVDRCAKAVNETATHTNARSYTIQNILITNCISSSYCVVIDGDNVAGSATFTGLYLIGNRTDISLSGCNGVTLSNTVVITSTNGPINFLAGTGAGVTITDCYLGQSASSINAGLISLGAGTNLTLTATKNVLYNCSYHGLYSIGGTNCTLASSYNDIMLCGIASTIYGIYRTANTVTSNYDYIAGCATRPDYIVDTSANTQINGTITRTNARSTPNKPLTCDNVVVGTPTHNSVTITFDCATGTGVTARCHGIGFVEYGTTSGVYTASSLNDDISNPITLGKYWTGWSTKYTFKQTGHSVTLNNLQASKLYYFRTGFIDPIGRVGYCSGGSFTTASLRGPIPIAP